MENYWLNALWSVTPTVLIGGIFWFVMYVIIRADRKERKVYSRIESEERQRAQNATGQADQAEGSDAAREDSF